MSDKLEFKFNSKNVIDFVKGALDANHNASRKTLNFLGMQIVRDAVMMPPTPRIDTGNARGSWSIKVGNDAIKYSDGSIAGYSKPKNMLSPEVSGMQTYELRVGFNVPYAYAIHEGVHEDGRIMGFGLKSEDARPKTGNFFLSSKFKTREKEWLRRAATWYTDFLIEEMKA